MSDQEIKKEIEKIFVNPNVAARLVNVATSTKPAGWSHRSNAPYYKRMYALEIQPFIDRMMVDKQDIIYRYVKWCTVETGISPTTLYFRVNQSIRYLVECMDTPDHKYGQWLELVNITRNRDVGVLISYIPGFGKVDGVQLQPESVTPQSSKPVWVRKMDDWLEDDSNYEPYVKEGLNLTAQEVVDLKVRIYTLKNIQASINQDRVALIRLNV